MESRESSPTTDSLASSPDELSVIRNTHSTKLSEEKKECLKSAWIDVKEGRMTMYRAAKEHNVSLSTLWKWCQRTDVDEAVPSVGRPCFLGAHLEHKLKNWIFEAARTGFPVTPQLLKHEALKYNDENEIVDGWQPGDKWYYGFLHRNPDISLRTPQYISAKKRAMTEPEIREWYQKVIHAILLQIHILISCFVDIKR